MGTPVKRSKERSKVQSGKSGGSLTGKRAGSAGSFSVQKVSRDQMATALVDLGVIDPKHDPDVSRFVVIEVARGKGKTDSKKIFKVRPRHNRIATSEAARQAEVIAHASEALDGQANAMRWLQRSNRSLAGRSPLDVLTNGQQEGVERVDELLYAIEYGMYV
ncbi:MAG TPA: MbcA/ParS/Xre antitoxin family protein [Bryobacteraceae bacterium]|nr:MbcA/ParS/Xre antitoxin family protein [Bryobacteraceae bacterium]